eukprot:365220-Chlamydomonas_euryale.AAC.2
MFPSGRGNSSRNETRIQRTQRVAACRRANYCVLCLAYVFTELQESPGLPARPTGANGLEDHVAISLVNLFRSSNSAAQDSSSLGSHVDDDTSNFESREGMSEEGSLGSAPLSTEASKSIASEVAATARTRGVHAVSSEDVDIIDEDSNGAAIVDEKSPPGAAHSLRDEGDAARRFLIAVRLFRAGAHAEAQAW